MGTAVILNIYDLSPANDCLYNAGLGLHHSGVEIMGSEYTFASGSGIFEMTPKQEQGAKFRESIELGIFEGDSAKIRSVISDLRNEFSPGAYNLITKNCNHFANALVYSLIGKQIPSYVNRLANLGSFFSCLLPKKMLESAPVGDTSGGNSSSGFQMHAPAKVNNYAPAFNGSGHTLGSSSASSSSSSGPGTGIRGVLGKVGGFGGSSTGTSAKGADDLTDRRERARRAAMARLLKEDDKSQ